MKSMYLVRLYGYCFLFAAITVLFVGCKPSEPKKTAIGEQGYFPAFYNGSSKGADGEV